MPVRAATIWVAQVTLVADGLGGPPSTQQSSKRTRPGVTDLAHGDEVHGFVFSSSDLSAHWSRLDEFEGEGYVRVLVPARLASGTTVDAYIYALCTSLCFWPEADTTGYWI